MPKGIPNDKRKRRIKLTAARDLTNGHSNGHTNRAAAVDAAWAELHRTIMADHGATLEALAAAGRVQVIRR
jgi:hypothetical protein